MKILLTNTHMFQLGGSETYTYAIAKELYTCGHEVDLFTLAPGMVSDRIELEGLAKVVGGASLSFYDVGLINHNTCFEVVKSHCAVTILTIHGLFDKREIPAEGADAYIGISDEIRDVLMGKHRIKAKVILNGVDCERFGGGFLPIHAKPRVILSMCQGYNARRLVWDAAGLLGAEYLDVDGSQTEWAVQEKMKQADVVVGLGRSLYEAMACGRNVFVYDCRMYMRSCLGDGFVTPWNIRRIQETNFSGRRFRAQFTPTTLADHIQRYYDEAYGKINREYALKNLNIKNQVGKYMALAEKLLEKSTHVQT